MVAVSTFPAAKSHVVSKIRALTGFQPTTPSGTAVSYGHPGTPENEHVWLTGAVTPDQEWGPFGQRKKDEKYAIKGFILVTTAGNSQQEATERAFVIFSAIENALRTAAEITLNGAVGVIQANVVWTGAFEGATAEGHQTLIEFDVRVSARV